MSTKRQETATIVAESSDWFTGAVVYQVYPRSFSDSNGDGVGDLRGVIERLDYLHTLGVDVVWLSPVYASPQNDNGYDISDYRDIDPLFGSLADLDELIAQLHARGMKLIMDLVVNHTSHEHPWFRESRSSLTNPKRDWYWWRAPENGAEPNNWGAAFSGPAWTLDETTGEYYLHLFSPQQPDLNWENPEVRAAVYEMMNWWLDRGVDGFRMDVINYISKDPALPDGRVWGSNRYGDGSAFYISGPRIHEYLQEMHREVFSPRAGALLTVGEMPGVTVDDARLFTDAARDELTMVFQFEHVGLDHDGSKWRPKVLDLVDLKQSLGRWQEGLADRGWNSLYWSNHDQPRVVSRFGDDGAYRELSAKMLAGILHTHRGTPFIYQGEELGMTNMAFSAIDEYRDIEAINYFREATDVLGLPEHETLASLAQHNRDNARTPMQWSGYPGAGFTTGEPWIAINPNSASINAAEQVGRDDSVFEFYRRLIALRHSEPIIARGDFRMLLPDDPRVYAFTRSWGEQELLVLGNFGAQPVEPDVDPAWASAALLLGNYPDHTSLALRPWELKVLTKTRAM